MIPDLGGHALAVLAAYGVAVVLIAGLVALTLWQGARVHRALAEVERRQRGRDG